MKQLRLVDVAFKYSQLLLLLILILFLSLTTESFLTVGNISNVIMQQVPFLLIISIGMTMAILTKGIDLSIGATLALSSCIAAYFINDGNIFLGIVVGLMVGLAVGCVNGLLITKVKLVPFIATYTMNMVVRGLTYLFMGGMLYYGFDPRFRTLATGDVLGISNVIIFAMLIFLVLLFVLKKTTFGRNVYSIGLNKEATKLSGINTDKVLISVYAINGLLAAITGILYIARLNAAEGTIGDGFTIRLMAATLIGGTPFSGGRGGIERTLLGVLIMMFLANGMNLNGISSLWQEAVFGGVIILSLIINKIGEKVTAPKSGLPASSS